MFSTREKHFGTDKTYDAGNMVMPTRCAVCDCEEAEPFTYVQGHYPIAVPGFGGVYRSTTVTIPYCKYHADAFRFRFRVLEITQYAIIAIGFACLYAGFAMEGRKPAADQGFNAVSLVGVFCFVILLPGSLIVRRYMYDAFFLVRPGWVEVRSKYQYFLDNLCAVNEPTAASEDPRIGGENA